MLYDPKWQNTTTKPDVFSLETLIAWLEKQPTDKRYDWENCNGECLIGLYGAAHGLDWAFMLARDETTGIPNYNRIARNGIALKSPRTFGGALERARALLET